VAHRFYLEIIDLIDPLNRATPQRTIPRSEYFTNSPKQLPVDEHGFGQRFLLI